MKFPSDQELFFNIDGSGLPVIEKGTIDPAAAELNAFNDRLCRFAQSSRMFESRPDNEKMAGIKKSIYDKLEELLCMDYICGFPVSHLEYHEYTYDYFDSHLGSSTDGCFGAFRVLREKLLCLYCFNFNFIQLLLTLATLFVLSRDTDGKINIITAILLIATPVSLLMSDLTEGKWLAKIVCSPVTIVGFGVLTIVCLVNAFTSLNHWLSPLFTGCYLVLLATILLDYVRQLFCCAKNGKIKKEYRKLYEEYAPVIHRYIRYHVIWWKTEYPGKPMPDCIQNMENQFNYFTKMY